jgi:uncharacterized protein (TIGR02145 family)
LALFSACENGESDPKVPQILGDTLLIDVSGQQYKIRRFGDALWMMENFRSTRGTNPIYVYDAIQPQTDKIPYYGLLYNFQTAKELQPKYWAIPSEADLDALLEYMETTREQAGAFLKGDADWTTTQSDGVTLNFAPTGLGYIETHDREGYGTECYFFLSDRDEKLGVKVAKMVDSSQAITVDYHNEVEEYMTVRYIMYSPQWE